MTHTSEPTFDLKPSQYLRAKRPELYSDSKKVQQYKIDRATLDHHLSTFTERNQHKVFEDFCRKVAEREICPNLRPQTGPEGGGDGKIDIETFPVSDRIAETWYVGYPKSNKELWGFAISANKAWDSKVQKDVKNAIGTNRGYSKIFFFTNQNPSQKKRLAMQDKLEKKFGIPITIFERSWLVDKTMANEHSDLVFEILNIGEYNPECAQKGPLDVMRNRELQKIEKMIKRVDKLGLSDINMVSDTLRAANLSRGLELPRYETDGRYERATRIADKYGGAFQKFLARYEKARTQIYWFDDLEEAHKLYDELEALAIEIKTSKVLELLGNILDALAYYQRNFKCTDFKLKNRFDTLRENLEILASNLSRPNESLHARTLLKINELKTLWRSRDSKGIDKIMLDLADILNESKGMGEFPSSLIPAIVNELPNLQIEGEAYDRLISIVAEYSGQKTSEGEQGMLLKKRGLQAIETGSLLDAIDWLGKATLAFSKAEYRDEQIETKYFLAVAYEKGNLL